jgi:hypothetical protein
MIMLGHELHAGETFPATCPATFCGVVLTKTDLSTVAYSEGGSSIERRRIVFSHELAWTCIQLLIPCAQFS